MILGDLKHTQGVQAAVQAIMKVGTLQEFVRTAAIREVKLVHMSRRTSFRI